MIPFVHAFAMFAAGRGFDQIRNTVCYPRLNVKIVGTHAGLTVGEDAATHQCLEDLALMRSIPGMTVICPADGEETRQAVGRFRSTRARLSSARAPGGRPGFRL
jgi:transketolase